jgi:hypothetical protein
MLRLIHNRLLGKYALAFAGLVIAGYFAANAFPIGDWSARQFLTDVPGSPQILGGLAALMMFVLVILLFFHREYFREDIKEYSRLRNDDRFINAFKWFSWFVLALEFCSVSFRWYLLNWSRLGLVLFAIGIVGLGLTHILSLVLHALVNRPAASAAAHLRETAAREVFEDGEKVLPSLSIRDKRRVAAGDPSPIDNVRNKKWQEREDAVEADRKRQKAIDDDLAERQRIADAEARKNERFYTQMVSPEQPTPDPLEMPSQNGHSRNPR